MIFTVGLGNLTDPRTLATLARRTGARVVDVRASLKYRRAGFGRIQLTSMLVDRMVSYEHRPDLGGLPVSQRATGRALPEIPFWRLESLFKPRATNMLIVCACGTPGDCHRHLTIAMPLVRDGARVWHVYYDREHGEQFIDARELQRAIDDGDDYTFLRAKDVIG